MSLPINFDSNGDKWTKSSLDIVCLHCARTTRISDWPRTDRTPIAFTCLTKHGGCGGHAYVEPPDIRGFPNLAVYVVIPAPMTPQQYRVATSRATPPDAAKDA